LLLNDEATRKFVSECSLYLMTALVAADHKDDVFTFCFRRRIESGYSGQYRVLCNLECQLDHLPFDERKIDTIMYAPTHRYNGLILADRLTAPPAFSLKPFRTSGKQFRDMTATPSTNQLPEVAHFVRVAQERSPSPELVVPTRLS
jgi:hypothetical protein